MGATQAHARMPLLLWLCVVTVMERVLAATSHQEPYPGRIQSLHGQAAV